MEIPIEVNLTTFLSGGTNAFEPMHPIIDMVLAG
jgi:hypothetical protein